MADEYDRCDRTLTKRERFYHYIEDDLNLFEDSFFKKIFKSHPMLKFLSFTYPFLHHEKVLPFFSKIMHSLMRLPSPEEIPLGISVVMFVKNEEDWISMALDSVSVIADEMIILDNGSDDLTFDIVCEYKRNHPDLDITIIKNANNNHCEMLNDLFSHAKYRYRLIWAGDFVARTSGKQSIMELKEWIKSLDHSKYYAIRYPVINFAGDWRHMRKGRETGMGDYYIWTNTTQSYACWEGKWVSMKIPFFYTKIDFMDFTVFHACEVKPKKRFLYRHYWDQWGECIDKERWPTIESYMLDHIKEDWGADDVEAAADEYMKQRYQDLVAYDVERFGPYPELLKDELENPTYKVIKEDGKFVRREERKST
ncbi:MAG: glycosyltransferase [Candidatus Thermoplasmatota archaeon]|nr:glycosyltransferase [Candidatus Thermoplasmatota archaeon]